MRFLSNAFANWGGGDAFTCPFGMLNQKQENFLTMQIGLENDSDVERTLAWMHHVAGPDLVRRIEAAKEHFSSACLPTAGSMLWPDPMDLLPPGDLPAGMLLQAHALIRDRRFFDARLASRTIPFLKLIGGTLPQLHRVEGAEARAREFLNPRNDHPEGGLLELTTAARYLLEGYRLRFIPESDRRTPDIELLSDRGNAKIECKRLRPGQYELSETTKVRGMFALVCDLVAARNSFVHLDVTFLAPLDSVPASYLMEHMECALGENPIDYAWEDSFARGRIVQGDHQALSEDTADSSLLVGPKLFRLFTQTVVPSQRVLMGVRGTSHDLDPRYLDRFEAVALCSWDTESPESIEARARHVRSKLAEIDRQLEGCALGAAHIVADAERDANAADLRRKRIQEQITGFRFDSNIGAITTHYLLTHTAETKAWTMDETADYASRMPLPLLGDPRLFMKGEELGTEPAWRYPAPN